MAHTYNPVPVLDTSFTTPDDGDAANVASIVMVLDLADASKFFADLLDGTSTGVVLQDPEWTGILSSDATGTIIALGGGTLGGFTANNSGAIVVGTFDVTGASTIATLTATTGHFTGAVDCDSSLNVDGAAVIDLTLSVGGLASLDSINIDSGAIIADSTLFNFTTTPIRVAGGMKFTSTGRIQFNSAAGSASNDTINLGDPQVIMVPTLSGNITYTIAEAGMDEGDWFLISATADTHSASGFGVTVARGVDASQIGPSVVKGGATGTVESMLVIYRNGRLQPALWGAVHA